MDTTSPASTEVPKALLPNATASGSSSSHHARLQSAAQAAVYAFHQNALTFGLNRLTGRGQSLADKKGWLVNTHV